VPAPTFNVHVLEVEDRRRNTLPYSKNINVIMVFLHAFSLILLLGWVKNYSCITCKICITCLLFPFT